MPSADGETNDPDFSADTNMRQGSVKSIGRAGFGFISMHPLRRERRTDVYFHFTAPGNHEASRLRVGQEVEFFLHVTTAGRSQAHGLRALSPPGYRGRPGRSPDRDGSTGRFRREAERSRDRSQGERNRSHDVERGADPGIHAALDSDDAGAERSRRQAVHLQKIRRHLLDEEQSRNTREQRIEERKRLWEEQANSAGRSQNDTAEAEPKETDRGKMAENIKTVHAGAMMQPTIVPGGYVPTRWDQRQKVAMPSVEIQEAGGEAPDTVSNTTTKARGATSAGGPMQGDRKLRKDSKRKSADSVQTSQGAVRPRSKWDDDSEGGNDGGHGDGDSVGDVEDDDVGSPATRFSPGPQRDNRPKPIMDRTTEHSEETTEVRPVEQEASILAYIAPHPAREISAVQEGDVQLFGQEPELKRSRWGCDNEDDMERQLRERALAQLKGKEGAGARSEGGNDDTRGGREEGVRQHRSTKEREDPRKGRSWEVDRRKSGKNDGHSDIRDDNKELQMQEMTEQHVVNQGDFEEEDGTGAGEGATETSQRKSGDHRSKGSKRSRSRRRSRSRDLRRRSQGGHSRENKEGRRGREQDDDMQRARSDRDEWRRRSSQDGVSSTREVNENFSRNEQKNVRRIENGFLVASSAGQKDRIYPDEGDAQAIISTGEIKAAMSLDDLAALINSRVCSQCTEARNPMCFRCIFMQSVDMSVPGCRGANSEPPA